MYTPVRERYVHTQKFLEAGGDSGLHLLMRLGDALLVVVADILALGARHAVVVRGDTNSAF